MSQVSLAREYAEKLDADDPLSGFRDRFALDDPSLVYLNGNSLGALPRATLRRLEDVIREEWGTALARSWDHWVDLPARAGARSSPTRTTSPATATCWRGSRPSAAPGCAC